MIISERIDIVFFIGHLLKSFAPQKKGNRMFDSPFLIKGLKRFSILFLLYKITL